MQLLWTSLLSCVIIIRTKHSICAIFQFLLLFWILLLSKHENSIMWILWNLSLLSEHTCCLAIVYYVLTPVHTLLGRAADKGLSLTLMERLVKEFGDSITSTLTTQYRMHTAIMTWPSHVLYEDTLIAHDTVAHHLLRWSVVTLYIYTGTVEAKKS